MSLEQDKALLADAVARGLITGVDATRCLETARQRGLPVTVVLAEQGLGRTLGLPPPAAPGGNATWWNQEASGQAPPGASMFAATPARPPRLLGGDFEVLEPLGEGGMGVVYRGRQRSLDREVALKVLPPDVGGVSGERFLREARAAAAVSHGNVITVFAAGRDEPSGRLFIAMELVRGGDAAALMKQSGGKVPERRALEIARDVAQGLTAIEAAGMVHRDIKPANIFLAPDGRAKLADLGLARGLADRMTETGAVVGTPAYMSPEQAQGRQSDIDIGTDIYAVGASLYALVTGKPPFEAGSVVGLLRKVLDEAAPDPRALEPTVSAALAAIVRRAMSKQRADRHATAADLVADLERALAASKGQHQGGRRRSQTLAGGAIAFAVIAWVVAVAVAVALNLDAAPVAVTPPVAPTERALPVTVVPEPPPPTPPPTPPPEPVVVVGEAAPVATMTSIVLAWNDKGPRTNPDLVVTEQRLVQATPKHLVLATSGDSWITARFTIHGAPSWARLRLGHSGTNAQGLKASFIDVEVNGHLLVACGRPEDNRLLDLTGVVGPGDNVLRISLHRSSRTVYWLMRLEVLHGIGLPPGD